MSLWFLEDDPKLPPQIKQMIEVGNDVFVSIIALWEVAIKVAIKISVGKLELQFEFQKLTDFLDDLDIKVLTISFEDIKRYSDPK